MAVKHRDSVNFCLNCGAEFELDEIPGLERQQLFDGGGGLRQLGDELSTSADWICCFSRFNQRPSCSSASLCTVVWVARGKAVEGGSFQVALGQALQSVSAAHHDATRLQREVQMDNPSVSLEETMVAMQKAQIGFQATLQVRNRLVQAYTDIMNMHV